MAKCFFTGVEICLKNTYLLDIGATNRVIRDLRQQLQAVERLLDQLGSRDEIEEYNPFLHKKTTRKHIRLVTPEVAKSLSAVFPKESLFICWPEWKKRKPHFKSSKTVVPLPSSTIPKLDNEISTCQNNEACNE